MNRKEFEKICKACGYARKEVAEEYCCEKDEFTDRDFEEVYRKQQRKDLSACGTGFGKWHNVQGVKITKCYRNVGGDKL